MSGYFNIKNFESLYNKTESVMYSKFIGRIYRTTKELMGQDCTPEMISERENNPDYDERLVERVDRYLPQFNKKTQLIIRKEFLEDSPEGWHEAYFHASDYSAIRARAAEKFANCFRCY
ncbi:MAG: hypothetical protein IIZ57_02340 [Solobacterium sp.]|nr:hypothetical protein [Solobacterium sp.]